MSYRFILNETSYHGNGAINDIPGEIQRRGLKKALVVTDQDLVKYKVVAKVTDLLDENQQDYAVFDKVMPNPTVTIVKEAVSAFTACGADYLIAIGGGSPQDVAKAVSIIIANPEFADVVSLEGLAPTKNKGIPVIAVPTTAGTAAEATINYVITDEARHRKFVCVDPHDIPILAVVDPDMTASMPAGLTAATGMDALTHAIEAIVTPGAWELSDTLNLEAVRLIARALPKAVKNDPEGRRLMALAQYMTGMAFSNVGLGLVHGMAHPLSAFYDTPHGIANAVLLPHVMAFNAEHTGDKYRAIAEAMGVEGTKDMAIEDARNAAVCAVRLLSAQVHIPASLKDIGVKHDDLEALAVAAMQDVCTGGNPRTCTENQILMVFEKAYEGTLI